MGVSTRRARARPKRLLGGASHAASCDRFAARPAASGYPPLRFGASAAAEALLQAMSFALLGMTSHRRAQFIETPVKVAIDGSCITPIRAVNEAALVALIGVFHVFTHQILQ